MCRVRETLAGGGENGWQKLAGDRDRRDMVGRGQKCQDSGSILET